jgi:hypothetical protein
MKTIQLTKGYEAQVDDEDYERINAFKWRANVHKCGVYATRAHWLGGGKYKTVHMHRQILGLPQNREKIVDHIDGNPLNNTKANLRICTYQQNNANSRGKSETRGVRVYRGKWEASITVNRKTLYIGRYSELEQASSAYREQQIKHFGEFAKVERHE